MRAYVITTGLVFALVTAAHLARSKEIWQSIDREPWSAVMFTLLTIVSAALAIWAWRILRRLPRSSPNAHV